MLRIKLFVNFILLLVLTCDFYIIYVIHISIFVAVSQPYLWFCHFPSGFSSPFPVPVPISGLLSITLSFFRLVYIPYACRISFPKLFLITAVDYLSFSSSITGYPNQNLMGCYPLISVWFTIFLSTHILYSLKLYFSDPHGLITYYMVCYTKLHNM